MKSIKNRILIMGITAMAVQGNVIATDKTNSVKVVRYEVEGKSYYDVSGCVPGSDIAFYSQKTGGVMLKSSSVNSSGEVVIEEGTKFAPAFVLNVNHSNSSGVKGNSMVAFVGDKEFTLDHLKVTEANGKAVVMWDAAVSDEAAFTFTLLKSVNGGEFAPVATLPATAQPMAAYSYTDHVLPADEVNYMVRVAKKQGVTYTSRPIAPSASSNITIYPTVATNEVNIVMGNANATAQYSIADVQGRIMQAGTITGNRTTIAVQNLTPGNYLIKVATDKGKTTTMKFVKQ